MVSLVGKPDLDPIGNNLDAIPSESVFQAHQAATVLAVAAIVLLPCAALYVAGTVFGFHARLAADAVPWWVRAPFGALFGMTLTLVLHPAAQAALCAIPFGATVCWYWLPLPLTPCVFATGILCALLAVRDMLRTRGEN